MGYRSDDRSGTHLLFVLFSTVDKRHQHIKRLGYLNQWQCCLKKFQLSSSMKKYQPKNSSSDVDTNF
jgi:hypothetical protein